MCRQCGALVGAGESHCTMCGATSTAGAQREEGKASARPAHRHDHETMRFVRGIISRPATFTFVFIIANVFLYLLMELSGGATGDVLRAYGAKLNYLIDHQGQWWRFVTPIFLHVQMPGFGPLHLLVNMYGLFMLGPYVEKLYGSAKFVVFWIVTGVAGVLASYLTVRPESAASSLGRFLFKEVDAPSAGASGALFGLVGVLFIFGIKYRHELPEGFKRAFGTGMLPMIAINLFIGYIGRGFIDNAAHLGGLLAGMMLALLVGYKRPGERGPVAYVWHVLQIGMLALVAACFVLVALNFDGATPSLQRPPTGSLTGVEGLANYLDAINESGPAFDAALKGEGGSVERIATVKAKLEASRALDERDAELRAELQSVLDGAREFGAQPEQERRSRRGIARHNELVKAYDAWHERFLAWVKTEGPRHGIESRDAVPREGEAK
jgi:membrane associated rhomboid family serine protease